MPIDTGRMRALRAAARLRPLMFQSQTDAELVVEAVNSLDKMCDENQRLRAEARHARRAIRHALQFLLDPTHRGDGHLYECIGDCRDVLKYEPAALTPQEAPDGV